MESDTKKYNTQFPISVSSNHYQKNYPYNRLDKETVKDIPIRAEDQGFNSQAGPTEYNVVNGSPPLRRFFGAVSRR